MTTKNLGNSSINYNNLEEVIALLRQHNWFPEKNQDSDFAVCMPALLVALKIPLEVNDLCEILPYKKENLSLIDLLNCFAHIGYIARPARTRLCDIDTRLLPCLFVPEKHDLEKQKAMVIFDKVDEDNEESFFNIYYGGNEKKFKIDGDNSTFGTAYFFLRETELDDESSSDLGVKAGLSWFRTILERFRNVFYQIFILSFILGIVSLTAPLFVMMVYDKVINNNIPENLPPMLFAVTLALITEWGVRCIRSRSVSWFGARLDNIISNKIFEKLLFMPPLMTERAPVASQISRLKVFEVVRDFFSGQLFLAIIELPFTVIIMITLFIIAGSIALIPLITVVIYLILLCWIHPKIKVATKLAGINSTNRQQVTIEFFDKIHSLHINGMTDASLAKYREYSGKACLSSFRLNYLISISENIAHCIFLIAGLATLVYGIEKVWSGEMMTGALIACMILVWRVLSPFQMLCLSLPKFSQVFGAIGQINRMMKIKNERNSEEIKARIYKLNGDITFDKVGLRYTRDTDPVFGGLSFNIKFGEILAITGKNASGKSSILKLINHIYSPQSGSILIDGIDIRQFDTIEIRKHITYISQNPFFFNTSIIENLRYVEHFASDRDIINALKEVDAYDEVLDLSEGLDTILNENNMMNISNSLSYRLSLAKAYLKQTSIILIDELPFSLLNSNTGKKLKNNIKKWQGNKTVVFVTHREDYLKLASKAIYLRKGNMPLINTPEKIIEAIKRSD